jgi:hypothetical protein
MRGNLVLGFNDAGEAFSGLKELCITIIIYASKQIYLPLISLAALRSDAMQISNGRCWGTGSCTML